MKLYKISQSTNQDYDTFDSAIVAAESEDAARLIHPGGGEFGERWGTWCKSPDDVTVELIGKAINSIEAGVILGSFNAG